FVDVYSTRGHLLRRLIRRGELNAPWGLVQAPAAGFGRFSGALLVGNFGDGRINAYDPWTGAFRGRLRHEDGSPIQIEGLWGLRFGNGITGTPTTLLFTAGIDDEANGLFGAIQARANKMHGADWGWCSVVVGDQGTLDRGVDLPVEPDAGGQSQQSLG